MLWFALSALRLNPHYYNLVYSNCCHTPFSAEGCLTDFNRAERQINQLSSAYLWKLMMSCYIKDRDKDKALRYPTPPVKCSDWKNIHFRGTHSWTRKQNKLTGMEVGYDLYWLNSDLTTVRLNSDLTTDRQSGWTLTSPLSGSQVELWPHHCQVVRLNSDLTTVR